MLLERCAVWVGRNVPLPGSGRAIRMLYPCTHGTARYVRGLRRRGDGLLVHVDSRNVIEWHLLFRGEYEPHMRLVVERLIRPGSTAVDVGANVGAHTLTFARLVGQSGTVLAFEPNPTTRATLARNVQANGLSNVAIYDVALGARSEVLPLRVPRCDTPEYANMGLASLVALDTPHDSLDVQVLALDDIVFQEEPGPIDLIKIDVQGGEFRVLEGMSRLLRAHRPALILEFEDWTWTKAGASIGSLTELLDANGYQLWTIGTGGRRPTLTRLTEVSSVGSHADLLALKAGDPRVSSFSLQTQSH